MIGGGWADVLEGMEASLSGLEWGGGENAASLLAMIALKAHHVALVSDKFAQARRNLAITGRIFTFALQNLMKIVRNLVPEVANFRIRPSEKEEIGACREEIFTTREEILTGREKFFTGRDKYLTSREEFFIAGEEIFTIIGKIAAIFGPFRGAGCLFLPVNARNQAGGVVAFTLNPAA